MKKEELTPMKITVTIDDSADTSSSGLGIDTSTGSTIVAALDQGEYTQVLLAGGFSAASLAQAIYHILKSLALDGDHKISVDMAIMQYQDMISQRPKTEGPDDLLTSLLEGLRRTSLKGN